MKDLHLENIRKDFTVGSLNRKDMPQNPMEKVDIWIREAIENTSVIEPTAMIVATSTPAGLPSVRTVLLKEVVDGEFIFYTNYTSRKGEQIDKNPNVALTFLWLSLERQIHVEGTIRKLSAEQSDLYFKQRPYKSRVGARISPQSKVIINREYIMASFAKESLKYVGRSVPRPDYWGGYAVQPKRIEFWQGRPSRLHDRFLYELQDDGTWSLDRLAP